MVVAVTFLALILHLPSGRPPGHVLVEILTLLTVIPPKVIIDVITERQVIVAEVPTLYSAHSCTSRAPSQ